MKISKEARKISKQLFLDSFVNGQLDEARVRNIARTLIDEKPRKFTEILKNYQRLIRLELAKHHAVIESVTNLDSETRRQLLGSLRAKYGEQLTTEFKTSRDLIGGLRIKIGSDVWDSTVRGRLARLESNLATA
jgi:F-type H+-transporting ATPase subunit delta